MLGRETLIDAVEDSLLFPEVPGHIWLLSVPGIEARRTIIPSPEFNLVGKTRLTKETVDATIAQVKDIFRQEGTLFGWLVTPNSRPADLADHLLQAGFVLAVELSGMALTDLEQEIPTNSEVRVERQDMAEIDGIVPMMVRAYGLPLEAVETMADFSRALARYVTYWLYVGYLPESDEPVAFALTMILPDSPIVLLGGAATVPERRGRGVYSTLVARRLRDAHERGAQAAVIQANRATSAPIAAKLGFEELLPMTIYAWDPASGT
jgi:hypothetical protein